MIHTINPALGPLSNKALNRAGTMSPKTPSTPLFHPSRPRADSTAARLAMEAMIQERLDQLTRRLDDFNQQSFDLYTRTQQLAAEFQAKSKRLYQVEDHLLKVQGKPGLSDDFLAHGPQPRRLTNDLEELRMGVKTLRKKFQIAGSVVATVGWWQHMKQNAPDQPSPTGKPLTPMRTLSKKKKLPLEKIFTDISEATSELSPNETHLHASPIHEVNLLGLSSPPLTPKGPLSGSSLLMGLSLETKGDMLPVIPDHDIDMVPSTIMNTTPSFLDDAMLDKMPGHPNTNKFDEGAGSEEEPPVPVPAFLEFPSPPSPYVPLSEDGGSVETIQEPEPENDPVAPKRAHPTQEEDNKEEEVTIHKVEEHDGLQAPLSSLSEEIEPLLFEDTSVEETRLSKDDEPDMDTRNKPVNLTTSPTQEAPDTWVQAFWRFLIRIEYFVLGTAVLGAMMPDNIYTLCAGFFSALVYASLLIFHRVAAPPGSEAPKPPTGRVVVSQRLSRYASVKTRTIKTN